MWTQQNDEITGWSWFLLGANQELETERACWPHLVSDRLCCSLSEQTVPQFDRTKAAASLSKKNDLQVYQNCMFITFSRTACSSRLAHIHVCFLRYVVTALMESGYGLVARSIQRF